MSRPSSFCGSKVIFINDEMSFSFFDCRNVVMLNVVVMF